MRTRTSLLLVVLAACVAYGNTLFNGFVYDDEHTVQGSEFIQSLGNLGGVFTQMYFEETIESTWRPVTTITYFLDHAIFGPGPAGFHLANLLWHTAVCVALWALLQTLVGNAMGATIGAVLFAIHPLGSEAVNAIAFREDLLATLFVVLGFTLTVRLMRGQEPATPQLAGVAVAYLLACLSKENGTALIALVAAWWWLQGRMPASVPRARIAALAIALGGVVAVWATLHFVIMAQCTAMAPPDHWGGTRAASLWNFPRIFFHGLDLFVTPVGFSADYEWVAVPLWQSPWLWLGWLGIALWCLAILVCRHRAPVAGLGLVWWLIGLLPVSHLLPLYNPVADRFYYLPMVGLCIGVAWALDRLGRASTQWSREARIGLLAVGLAAAGGLIHLTVQRNLAWGDPERLWTATLEVEPRSTVALNNLAVLRLQSGRPTEAIDFLERSIAVNAREGDTLYNYGAALAIAGRWYEAEGTFRFLADQFPGEGKMHYWLAQCLIRGDEEDRDLAAAHLASAEEMGFEIPEAFLQQMALTSDKGESS